MQFVLEINFTGTCINMIRIRHKKTKQKHSLHKVSLKKRIVSLVHLHCMTAISTEQFFKY